MSEAWDRFIESLEGRSREWAASLDLDAMSQLEGIERERAESLLLSHLAIGSPRISRALAMFPGSRVRESLAMHLSSAKGEDRVATASALMQLGGSDAAAEAIRTGLLDPDLSVAHEALDAALKWGRSSVEPLVIAAATHPIRSVRIGAAKRALFLVGATRSFLEWDHRSVVIGIVDDDPEIRRQAFGELLGLLDLTSSYSGPWPLSPPLQR